MSAGDRPAPEAAGGDEALSFSEAMAELEAILRRVEAEAIDIDDLARELRRATRLLEVARAKIRRAEVEVTQIVQSLEGDAGGAAGEEDAGEGEESGEGDGSDEDVPF
jgi:exodeoxyribonuclease VII small subunit